MCVHRRIRIFQLHNSKIPETPRPKTLKEGKRVAATTTLNRRICNFQLLILRFQNPRPSKTLTDKAQQQQRFSTVSVRVFFFSRCEFASSSIFAATFASLQEHSSSKRKQKNKKKACIITMRYAMLFQFSGSLCFFFFLVFVFLLWFGLLVLTL